ncbi:MAG TPA: DNA gyrase modulator, partial [Candidatus Acidoferrales bacterium]|nr:DNA gyrase modulator [Candidatus Acidoferrales bacterium]
MEHRLGAAELRRIAEKIFKLSEADETEVDISAVTCALTRFANNTIHQNVAEQGLTISVRAVVDGRTARASTNKTDDESLRRVTTAALDLARVQPRNSELLPMLGQQKLTKVDRFVAQTAAATPADRARAVTSVCHMADKNKQTTAGIFSTGLAEIALANSRGLFEYYDDTRAEFSVTILEKDSSGWAKATSARIGDIEPEALARRASEKAASSRAPREIPTGRYTTILEPAAVLDLVGFLFYDFAATCVA